MRKYVSTALVSIFSFLVVAPLLLPVSAQSRNQLQQYVTPPSIEISPEPIDLCELATKKINHIIKTHKEIRDKHMRRYSHIINLLSKLADRLEELGIDVSELRKDIKHLKGLVHEFNNLYENFFLQLKEAKRYACNGNRQGFLKKMREARETLGKVKTKAEEIRKFIRSEILPGLRRIQVLQQETQKPTLTTDQAG